MNEEVNAAKMAEAAAKLATAANLMTDTDLKKTGYSQAFLINQALNNTANAQILLAQAQDILERLRT